MLDIGAWLRDLGLGRYEQAFLDNDIDAAVLADLTADDLIGLGVDSIGHRRKLLAAIPRLQAREAAARTPQHDLMPEPSRHELAPRPEAERRHVTVLFVDLVGFTRMSAELDAEDVHTLLERFFACVDGIVVSHGGTIDKHIGDCVMAVFGAPVAHGNDPERAARAALAVRDAMSGLTKAVGRDLAVHVGIASGQVVASGTGSASHREYTVTGGSVNLASRLTDRAAPGEILVSDAVWRLLSERFAFGERETLEVEGIAEPVETAYLIGSKGVSEPSRRPFVGRLAELRQFTGALEACVETGGGQPVYVRGEAGIGKTRLVEEFRRRAVDRGFACHSGLVLDFGTATGQDAIRALVRSLLGLSLGAAAAEAERAAARAIDDGIVAEENRVYLNDLLDLPQPLALRSLYDAMDNARRNQGKRETVAGLVESLSRGGALLLLVEDVHWVDRLTLEHLANLARVVADRPAVLVMTSRIEGDPLDGTWRQAIAGSPLMTIDLGPLRPKEAEALAGAYMDANAALARRCLERAAGNPLFLEQLLSHAEESAEAVPGSVQSLVQARLDRLEPTDKAALQAASVLGQRFALDALRHLVDSPDYAPSGPLKHHLVWPEGDGFLFAHALIRDAVYDSLLKTRRQELHRRAASWFGDQDLVLRADHLDRANDPEAPEAYLEASRQQAAEYRMERALTLAERGLALATAPASVHTLSCLTGDLLRESGEVERSIATFERALAGAQDNAGRCTALIGLAAGMRIVDRIDDALDALDRAQSLVAPRGLDRELSQIHYYRGNLYFPLGRIDDCLEQHELARRHALEAGSVEDEAHALSGLGDASYLRGRMITAHHHFDRCIEMCREHSLGRMQAANLVMRGETFFYRMQPAPALEDARLASEGAAKVGNRRAEVLARSLLARFRVQVGLWDEAPGQCERALALARDLGARRLQALPLAWLGHVARIKGDRLRAIACVGEAVAVARDTAPAFVLPWVLGVLSWVAEDFTVRRSARAEAEELLRKGCASHNYLWFYYLAMDACLDEGDWDTVEHYAATLEDYTRPEPLPWSDFYIARGRALAACGRGRRDARLRAEIERLAEEARQVGLRIALPALESALAGEPLAVGSRREI